MEPFLGIISDTHGLLRPEALEALTGAERILHAGDVGSPDVLRELERLAPVQAVRGNVDTKGSLTELPLLYEFEWKGFKGLMYHILPEIPVDPLKEKADLVIFGHSHKPEIRREDGILFLNPGSAGRRRFSLPVTLAKVFLRENHLSPELISLL